MKDTRSAPVSPETIALCRSRLAHEPVEGFLLGSGAVPAKVMFVGEAPGATEIQEGMPFTGQAGREMDAYLERLGLSRSEVYITSTVRSRPFKERIITRASGERVVSRSNRTPTKAEILAHAPILDEEIRLVRPQFLIPMGNIALHRLIGSHETVTSLHGKMIEGPVQQAAERDNPAAGYRFSLETYNIFPLFHPAAVLYNRKLSRTIESDLDILARILTE
ncbi:MULTISPECIES: uracil-DNA glycosylase [Paenibacillus]|uniref:Uracil-DNA glycosylase superfamily n=2 Tax=Paenibacillus lactis TaxID=228574 RepID=G4HPL9_9BACL|nr:MULTISPECIES: uracil-DNA glycosylase [Paenibacillus]EHB47556.1 Uracil-DNA glycosylase superfamily [Paenibacillus lactis 154]MBP1897002.1 DNA polymerase [Paenibacillus lactis]MCM3495355.1 uracil-DNA glycosylase [Paenibacillus lactis]GIO94834.1 uracil-DNA glycosylase [Paenibacillus lactis]HAF96717.1 uracil-DNA glycosylase [Paenibacillus lactis]